MPLVLSIIVAILIFGGVLVFFANSDTTDPMVVLFGFVIVGAIIMGGSSITISSSTTSETIPLQSLGTDTSVNGRTAFLGSGYVDSEPSYRYYVEVPDGTGRPYSDLREALASDSKVYQDAEEASVTIHTKKDIHIFNFGDSLSYTYEFNIPEGSVVETTALDLGK